jgi:hypothetical protein
VGFFRLYPLHLFLFSVTLNIKIKTMKSIIIKEIDQLQSKLHKNRLVSEYLVYLMQNDVKLACYSELGKESKDMRVNELIVSNFDLEIALEDIIQEVSFEELINN